MARTNRTQDFRFELGDTGKDDVMKSVEDITKAIIELNNEILHGDN